MQNIKMFKFLNEKLGLLVINLLFVMHGYGQVSSFQFAIPYQHRFEQLLKDSFDLKESSNTIMGLGFSDVDKRKLQLLPLSLSQQFNNNNPFGWNDEGMIPAKGYQVMTSAGFSAKYAFLHIQFYPQIVYAPNNSFDTAYESRLNTSQTYYFKLYKNWIDLPEYYGDKSFTKAYWGQSFISIENSKLSIRLSTENKWWGPGVLNSLVMSNNTAGFKL